MSGVIATLANTRNFAIGGYYNNDYRTNASVYYAALWKGANWLDTHLQATVASTRFAQLLGVYPGTAKGTDLQTTVTRAGPAYLDKVEGISRKLYYVGSNWIRTCKRTDTNSVTDSGLLIEATATNVCLQSEDLTTTWALGGSATRASNSATAPNGATTADTRF